MNVCHDHIMRKRLQLTKIASDFFDAFLPSSFPPFLPNLFLLVSPPLHSPLLPFALLLPRKCVELILKLKQRAN
uniref:Uncharacterized protein n=1 Tax=Daphnia magna TaxID=35525 RepID=A0A0N8DGP8_9CRUS